MGGKKKSSRCFGKNLQVVREGHMFKITGYLSFD